MGRLVTIKYPSSLVVVVRRTANGGLSIITDALGITDLFSSATLPLIEAVICWAWPPPEKRRKTAISQRNRRILSLAAADPWFVVPLDKLTTEVLFGF